MIYAKQPGAVPLGRPHSLGQYLAENGKMFDATTGVTTIATAAENDFVYLKNPTGSGKILRLNVAILTISATSNKSSFFRYYRNPTVTANGTALTINNRKSGGQASVMQVYKLPTISAKGNIFEIKNVGISSVVNNFNLEVMLNEGDSILISTQPSSTNMDTAVSLVWAEVNPTTLI